MEHLCPLALTLLTAACSSDRGVEWVDYGDDPLQNPQYTADLTAAGAVGPEHDLPMRRPGPWTVERQVRTAPGTEPMPMPATAEIEVLYGGRAIAEELTAEFWGMPFEGRLTQGYDNLTERYWAFWIDNTSTGYWLSHGREIEPGTIALEGTAVDVLTPSGRPMRIETTANEDGSYTMRFQDTRESVDEYMSMELRYTRS